MCGRLNLHDHEGIQRLMMQLGLPLFPIREPRFNSTPGSELDVLFRSEQGLEFARMIWGIEFGNFKHPNSKTETIQRKPFLQHLLLKQRCLVPVNRFYEWPDPKVRPKYKDIKTRFCIHTSDDVLLLAGIWKVNPDGIMQFNIITTDPNSQINDFHHRMPAIIPPEKALAWFDAKNLQALYSFLVPYEGKLIIYSCDSYVDSGRHEGPRCMAPAA